MLMNGLQFKISKPVEQGAPGRTDIALFIGFVSRRQSEVPDNILQWLLRQGFSDSTELMDVPVPIDDWNSFDHLFSWNKRTAVLDDVGGTEIEMDSYLGTAVQSFFKQGGRKCYVVRVGDIFDFNLLQSERLLMLDKLIPGYAGSVSASAADRASWRGAAYLYALPDVSIMSMPDLPELVSADNQEPSLDVPQQEAPPEQFVECSEPVSLIESDDLSRFLRLPLCDHTGYVEWAKIIRQVAILLTDPYAGRATHFLAAIPPPQAGSDAENNLLDYLVSNTWLQGSIHNNTESIASAFVQLIYPWLKIPEYRLPEDVDNPEGVFAGLMARNALLRGSYRSLNALPLVDISDVYPALKRNSLYEEYAENSVYKNTRYRFVDRVSVFNQEKQGVRLVSDVTSSEDISYRPANISRIVSMLVRESRRIGEELVFENNGERLWARIRARLTDFLLLHYQEGALRGATAKDAFYVRCDRSTMSQNDIDSGRVIAEIQFSPAATIEVMLVTLSLEETGQVVIKSESQGEAA